MLCTMIFFYAVVYFQSADGTLIGNLKLKISDVKVKSQCFNERELFYCIYFQRQ